MKKEEIQAKIQQAKELVGGEPGDPFTQVAFGEVLRLLLGGSYSIGEKERLPATTKELAQEQPEFLAQLNITTHIDRVVAILYHRHHSGDSLTTVEDLEEAYSDARVKAPRNFSDVLAQCIRKGYVVEVKDKKEGKKAWRITPSGEKYVEEELSQGSSK